MHGALDTLLVDEGVHAGDGDLLVRQAQAVLRPHEQDVHAGTVTSKQTGGIQQLLENLIEPL